MQFFKDVLNEDDTTYVFNKTYKGTTWEFKGYSNATGNGYTFWYMDLDEDTFFTKKFLSRINQLTGKKFELERVYANGQTYGFPGDLHTDVPADTYAAELYQTFVYYVNPVWDIRWGGQTIVLQQDGTADTVMYNHNTAAIFPSILKHFSSEPSRHCKDLRVTVAFKLKEII